MSQDPEEIVFDDIRFREPQKLRRPDRDRRWICGADEVPVPRDLPIFIDLKTTDAIERHALRDTSVELGGILLGKECIDDMTGEPFVWVTQSLEAKHYENSQASFTYTHDSWEEITRERDHSHPDLDIVGWYHTIPTSAFFSRATTFSFIATSSANHSNSRTWSTRFARLGTFSSGVTVGWSKSAASGSTPSAATECASRDSSTTWRTSTRRPNRPRFQALKARVSPLAWRPN